MRPDVAIIGAGVTGLSIALHLRERSDVEVVVYDRAGVGAGMSGVQPGGVRQQWGTEVNCRLARASLAFYRNLPAAAWDGAGIASGSPMSVRACAYITVGHDIHHRTLARERYR